MSIVIDFLSSLRIPFVFFISFGTVMMMSQKSIPASSPSTDSIYSSFPIESTILSSSYEANSAAASDALSSSCITYVLNSFPLISVFPISSKPSSSMAAFTSASSTSSIFSIYDVIFPVKDMSSLMIISPRIPQDDRSIKTAIHNAIEAVRLIFLMVLLSFRNFCNETHCN